MAITITEYATVPALDFKHVHVSDLHIVLAETQEAKASVRVTYKLYALDADGIKHFDRAQHVVVIEDYGQLATQKAMEGDMTLAGAWAAIEQAVAAILAGKHGTATVEA